MRPVSLSTRANGVPGSSRSAGTKTRARSERVHPLGLKTASEARASGRGAQGRGEAVQSGIEQRIRAVERLVGEGRFPAPLQRAGVDILEPFVPGIRRAPGVLIEERHPLVDPVDLVLDGCRRGFLGRHVGKGVQRLASANGGLRAPVEAERQGPGANTIDPPVGPIALVGGDPVAEAGLCGFEEVAVERQTQIGGRPTARSNRGPFPRSPGLAAHCRPARSACGGAGCRADRAA